MHIVSLCLSTTMKSSKKGYYTNDATRYRRKQDAAERERKRALLLDPQIWELSASKLAKKHGLTKAKVQYALKTGRVASSCTREQENGYLELHDEQALAKHISYLLKILKDPVPTSIVNQMAYSLRRDKDAGPPDASWHKRFRNRHDFESQLAQIRDKGKAKVDCKDIEEWIEENHDLLDGIPPENIANMDETGFQIGADRAHYAYSDAASNRWTSGTVRREPATSIECVLANGVALPPFVILKRLALSTVGNLLCPSDGKPTGCEEWGYDSTDTGYNCIRVMLKWLDHYDEHSKVHANPEKPRVLLMDNFSVHKHAELQIKAKDMGIRLVFLPPNTTDKIQPLDVKIFGPLKSSYFSTSCAKKYFISVLGPITRARNRDNWIESYRIAREKVMKAEKVSNAFKVTGIVPFAPQKITSKYSSLGKTTFQEEQEEHHGINLDMVNRILGLTGSTHRNFRHSYLRVLASYLENKVHEIDNEEQIQEIVKNYFDEHDYENPENPGPGKMKEKRSSEVLPETESPEALEIVSEAIDSEDEIGIRESELESQSPRFSTANFSSVNQAQEFPSSPPSTPPSTPPPSSTPLTPRRQIMFKAPVFSSPTIEHWEEDVALLHNTMHSDLSGYMEPNSEPYRDISSFDEAMEVVISQNACNRNLKAMLAQKQEELIKFDNFCEKMFKEFKKIRRECSSLVTSSMGSMVETTQNTGRKKRKVTPRFTETSAPSAKRGPG
ncbi:hypothetical protein TRVA0_003S04698 [Trichomonascus vanleenenianus]|uniref:uncharacterized protein n=1 Tax=Trichomonascus vanleenenianus TaxID=2268995 RepID=UPI003EC9E9C7